MIDGLSHLPSVRARHAEAPLLQEREQFLQYLYVRGSSRLYIRATAAYLIHIVRVMQLTSLRLTELAEIEKAGQSWATYVGPHRRSPIQGSPESFTRVARLWFEFHGSLVVPAPPPFAKQITEYQDDLRSGQGLAPATVRGYSTKTRVFLEWLASRDGTLEFIQPSRIAEYLTERRAAGDALGFLAAQCQALRSFFGYAEIRGWCPPGIPWSIRSPRVPSYKGPPRGPAWADVRKLLRFTSGPTPKDLRAHAILLLFSIYGLRSSEVGQLRLCDFDWRNETFTVRRAKRGGIQQFPIQYEVGEAIIRYLRDGRPRCSCRYVFVSLRSPHRPFGQPQMWKLVSSKMEECGIESAQVGPHSLRHACATRLLKQGSSLQEIADFLGHRDIGAVSIYARCDTRLLRKVAAFGLGKMR